MANRRIEYDATDGSHYSQTLNLLSTYKDAIESGDMGAAAGAADRAAHLSERLADHALVASDQSERSTAAAMGIPRSTYQYRLKRAHNRINGDEENQA